MEFTALKGDTAYLQVLEALCQGSDELGYVSPRGQPTRELLDVTVKLLRPEHAPPTWARTGFNSKIAAVETVQLIAGTSWLPQLDAASGGRFSRYANDGRLRGAYGPRLAKQFPEAERRLREDHDTRQAIVTLWRPDEPVTRDVPCTLSLTFRVRDDRLGLKVHMRSNDAMMGVPYDWFMFSRVQLLMAEVLDLEPGPYVHHVDSLHLYERDHGAALGMLDRAARTPYDERLVPDFSSDEVFGTDSSILFDSWEEAQFAAHELMFGRGTQENWYSSRVSAITEKVILCPRCRYLVSSDVTALDVDEVCLECWNG